MRRPDRDGRPPASFTRKVMVTLRGEDGLAVERQAHHASLPLATWVRIAAERLAAQPGGLYELFVQRRPRKKPAPPGVRP